MLSKKENFLETIKLDGKPDRLVNDWDTIQMIFGDPYGDLSYAAMPPGGSGYDAWGSYFEWPSDQPSPVPHPTSENLVIKDILTWENDLKIPPLENVPSDWDGIKEAIDNVDRTQSFATLMMAPGLFERCHRLMGFEELFIQMLEEPEAFESFVTALAEDRIKNAKILLDNVKPDIILTHDDWGTKHSMFISPNLWREYFKPHYKELFQLFHDNGVIVLHHSDSFLEPIVEDMVEIGIDIWQGALPENDIPKLQEIIAGRMTIMGGIGASIIDTVSADEATIRAEVRRACETYGPGGHFIPSITYGLPDSLLFPQVEAVMKDEIASYNYEKYGIKD